MKTNHEALLRLYFPATLTVDVFDKPSNQLVKAGSTVWVDRQEPVYAYTDNGAYSIILLDKQYERLPDTCPYCSNYTPCECGLN